ncbi:MULTISPECIES: hypothetical protein [unclassified Nodularia (in: cyanobacteria)]|uniref:hypothetical protein n=1 Tax=unclassified Nodularia (in: cyanobacteria) TaxID=2656917 RepID=UPI00187F9E6E|nr:MULTISPECIES: hypothetical protein [unclassified Nodularia (in: cyanobacteria)]MBE9197820.1 hypothetical protein [Nodularia sp. LEGE 06071]MCC2695493.1 hypothetical protein [Nodularia sp. LEGE 04288]
MSINKNKPHLFILPEDDDNKDIANGFLLDLNLNHRAIQVLPVAGGWMKVVDKFKNDHIKPMRDYPHRNIVLIIDFDGSKDRFSYVENFIPDDIKNRVFILGVKLEPKDLRRDTQKTCEAIGEALAKDCAENKNELWGHPLLIHNHTELERMIVSVKPFLFLT